MGETGDRDTVLSPKDGEGARIPVGPGLVLSGRYRLEGLLGSGGMGAVYRGEHLQLGVPVAVKVMHAGLATNADHARRFQREARATSQLVHPNVVRVLDAGEDQGLHFIVMEFLAGESLEAWLERHSKPPTLADVGDIAIQILRALETAHAAGIVHRDLKPENVFLQTDSQGTRTVKVVDFGLAHFDDKRDTGATLTRVDMVAGTPHYMSPEQCHSLVVGPSADLYAFGCILTDLLQLMPPFSGAKPIEIITQQLFLPPPPLKRPSDAEPVPPLLERLRLELLAKSPAGRPPTATLARERLEEALSAEATALRLPARKGDEPLGSRAERVPEWTRRAIPIPAAGPADPLGHQVGLVRLAPLAGGVESECVTGLAAQGVGVTLGDDANVVVLDAGSDVDAAKLWLDDHRAAAKGPRVLVCVANLTAVRMNLLIGAGAADVLAYPVTADALGRKVLRILRRGR
jgi:predicted Ser/Thr protein kinase